MAPNSKPSETAQALRDFFFATGGEGMRDAFHRLCAATDAPAPEVADWEREEFAFNRLFVGPGELKAPPYASVYLDPEPTLMGETTMTVRGIYNAVGLVSPWKNTLPDDHLSLELDAAAAMAATLDRSWDDKLGQLRAFFLQEHMLAWVPRFVRAVEDSGEDAPAVLYAARQLEDWLEQETEAVRVTAAG